ncbi:MAG: Bcr/CflA family efflux MFS transporter [Alphaproteobacteria bacterium]|nr:Bcr/CflA family efflux MFS transporter [Alphaproteobacteria bacterium]
MGSLTMRLSPTSFAMTALLAALATVGPFSTDTYMASMPQIARDLQTSSLEVQLTLSTYLIGFSVGQIIYGPVSDKYGRKPVILFGLLAYTLASLACMQAQSIEALIVLRAVQAFAAAAPIILARAIIRDLYEGTQAARQLSIMTSVSGFGPMAAPLLGGVLQVAFGWRSVFAAMFLIGLVLLVAMVSLMPETIRERQSERLSIASIFNSFGVIARNRIFRTYVSIQMNVYTCVFSFISTSSLILQNQYGCTPLEFSFAFFTASLAFLLGTFLNRVLMRRMSLDATIGIGIIHLCVGGWAHIVGVSLFPNNVYVFVAPVIVVFNGVGLIFPLTIAAALMPFPERAGAASSLMGVCQMLFAALVGAILGTLIDHSPLPLSFVLAGAGTCAGVIFIATRTLRSRARA